MEASYGPNDLVVCNLLPAFMHLQHCVLRAETAVVVFQILRIWRHALRAGTVQPTGRNGDALPCGCGVVRGVRPLCRRRRLIVMQVCGGSCSSLRGCNRAPALWVRIPCWAMRARGEAMLLLHNCANHCGWRRCRTVPQPARFAWVSGHCWQALRARGSAMQPTRRKGSSLAKGPLAWSQARSWQGGV